MNYITPGYEDLELSTQLIIREAQSRGLSVEVLDREANFIRISGGGRIEYVKQATKTRLDSYITFLMLESKLVSKLALSEAGLSVPAGLSYTSAETASASFSQWRGKPLVIKPNSTNFGTGVVVFPHGTDESGFRAGVDTAFAHDSRILIEDFAEGKEFRFLVIGDDVRAVLHRIPANVTGDGTSDIHELIQRKNLDPLRQEGYVSPLEKLKAGEAERLYLHRQGLDFSSVPTKGKTVFLRQNSNISTGGDSIDYTDKVHPRFNDLAVAAAKALGASVCGVDIVARDIESQPADDNYAVIEANFNPALHIHDFPHRGKNREVEKHLLDLLGFGRGLFAGED